MNLKSKILILPVLLFSIALCAPSAVEASCACSCQPKVILNTITSGVGSSTSTTMACDGTTGNISLGDKDNVAECEKACAELPAPAGSVDKPPCYRASSTCATGGTVSCWCEGGSGPYKNSETASETDCKKKCSESGQNFVAWSNAGAPLPANSIGVKCPPGGNWTPEECAATKNGDGKNIGIWKGPAGQKSGPYCFYSDIPINLGVGLGTVTQANLSEYLDTAYKLGLGMAAILAVIFIMIGGFRYLSAAGGEGVDAGKGMIKNAVVGLVLVALSYTLLQTVNPDILSLRLPTVQLIKSCPIAPIDCGSRKDKPTCEDNSIDSSKKCSWDTSASICSDLSLTQSGTSGQLGGPCKDECASLGAGNCETGNTATKACAWNSSVSRCVNKAGNLSCLAGECVNVDSNTSICSDFGTCQACKNSTMFNEDGIPDPGAKAQCKPAGDMPVMCIDNRCAKINVEDPPASKQRSLNKKNYILCTGATGCGNGDQCATGKCVNGKCIISNQGSDCMALGPDSCVDGSKCLDFPLPSGLKKVCCANGDGENCLGCDKTKNILDSTGKMTNVGCPKTMICSNEERCVIGL